MDTPNVLPSGESFVRFHQISFMGNTSTYFLFASHKILSATPSLRTRQSNFSANTIPPSSFKNIFFILPIQRPALLLCKNIYAYHLSMSSFSIVGKLNLHQHSSNLNIFSSPESISSTFTSSSSSSSCSSSSSSNSFFGSSFPSHLL